MAAKGKEANLPDRLSPLTKRTKLEEALLSNEGESKDEGASGFEGADLTSLSTWIPSVEAWEMAQKLWGAATPAVAGMVAERVKEEDSSQGPKKARVETAARFIMKAVELLGTVSLAEEANKVEVQVKEARKVYEEGLAQRK